MNPSRSAYLVRRILWPVTGLMTWARGAIRGAGTLNANGGIAMTATSTITLTDTRTLNNAGTATWDGPGTFSMGPNAIFNNLGGATFQIQTNADISSGNLNNMGTLTKEAGSGDGVTAISSFVDDTGTMTVISGTLQLSGSGMHEGTVSVMNGAAFNFTGGNHTVIGSITSPDTVGFVAGNVTFEGGVIKSVGAISDSDPRDGFGPNPEVNSPAGPGFNVRPN